MGIENWRDALLDSEATIGEAVASLDRSALQIALVTDGDERLVGTITDGDIRRGLLRGLSLDAPASEITHAEPMVVPPSLDGEIVLQIMSANKIHQLPIVDEARNVLGLHVWDAMQTPTRRPNTMVVMAGGKGTRLRPHTENCPKPLLPIAGKPMLEHIIERARLAGIERFYISVHYLGHMIEEHFGDGSEWGVSIEYIREDAPLGTGGALSLLEERPDAPFVVTNGDVMTDVGYGEMIDYHVLHRATGTMAVRNHEIRNEFGVVHTSGVDITGFEEKPLVRSHVNAGIYVLDPSVLDCLSPGKHCDMPTLFERLRQHNHRTIVYPLHEKWIDVGRPDDLQLARLANPDPRSE
ncbi:nucleotidyltransferase family protein [Pseudoblastomonas halimionae]|uniref:NTP transferase domain-containing protein n=1 Tax=Alteriqipengyuania halimionae TaxID=1926630 RepID=A0A6I4U689_9SPHN|nr:nucleotidyltransferase family protein [Alteriqipengyuania halimionae]MXP10914.1 NTP transferase domain-containing protein [Alteriqipengyuania halimionae]